MNRKARRRSDDQNPHCPSMKNSGRHGTWHQWHWFRYKSYAVNWHRSAPFILDMCLFWSTHNLLQTVFRETVYYRVYAVIIILTDLLLFLFSNQYRRLEQKPEYFKCLASSLMYEACKYYDKLTVIRRGQSQLQIGICRPANPVDSRVHFFTCVWGCVPRRTNFRNRN